MFEPGLVERTCDPVPAAFVTPELVNGVGADDAIITAANVRMSVATNTLVISTPLISSLILFYSSDLASPLREYLS